jgi:surface protein
VCLLFLGLLLDIESIPWPPALRKLMQKLNAWFNINLEMASPECSMTFTAIDKMQTTLWAPLVLVVIVLTYGMLRTCINYRDEFRKHKFATDEERSATRAHFMVRELQVWERAACRFGTISTQRAVTGARTSAPAIMSAYTRGEGTGNGRLDAAVDPWKTLTRAMGGGRGGCSRRRRCSRRLTASAWLLTTLALCGSVQAQTALTDANIGTAVTTCLGVDPVGGICPGTAYGSMPGWDTSAVTNMFRLFYNKGSFNADISTWNVGQVTYMDSSKSRLCGRCCCGHKAGWGATRGRQPSRCGRRCVLRSSRARVCVCSVLWCEQLQPIAGKLGCEPGH